MVHSDTHPFDVLTPDLLLDAVESLGYVTDGRVLALNSYENRVYQVGIADAEPLIAKFYRPARWSDAQILEEHDFCLGLANAELPVVPPVILQSQSLFEYQDCRFALYPRKGGHAPELANTEHLKILGHTLARMHNLGAASAFRHRPTLDSQAFGHASVAFLTEHFVPGELLPAWRTLTADILTLIDEHLTGEDIQMLRVHGDCHVGNILWRDNAPHFIDLDDARMAPAIQDLWMLLSGDEDEQRQQLSAVVKGYEMFRDFNSRELSLVQPLRTLRMLHFSAWIGRRWDDPAFPRAFPWFNSNRYWGDFILQLREQFSALREPPLVLI